MKSVTSSVFDVVDVRCKKDENVVDVKAFLSIQYVQV